MGVLNFFKKNRSDKAEEKSDFADQDIFKSDPFMDPDSGLNFPGEEETSQPYSQSFSDAKKYEDPFQKYAQEQNSKDSADSSKNFQESQKDFQLIIAKLDTIRAEIQSMNHRLEKLEQKQQKKMW